MSKIKNKKKVLTPEQKEKDASANIIIVAVILVAASVATYWMQPQNKALAESEVFSEEEVKAQAEKNHRAFKMQRILTACKALCPGHAGDHEQERMDEGKARISEELGRFCFH